MFDFSPNALYIVSSANIELGILADYTQATELNYHYFSPASSYAFMPMFRGDLTYSVLYYPPADRWGVAMMNYTKANNIVNWYFSVTNNITTKDDMTTWQMNRNRTYYYFAL